MNDIIFVFLDHLFDSVSNAVERRAGRYTRSTCAIIEGENWLSIVSCKAQHKSVGYCEDNTCFCNY